MNYVFSFSFSFEDKKNEESYTLETGFLVSGEALAALAPDISSPLTPYRVLRSESYQDWYSQVTEELEEQFVAVHDVYGTEDGNTMIDGFSTYEIETHERACELLDAWHNAFAKRVGSARGLGPVCVVDSRGLDRDLCEPQDYLDVFEPLSSMKKTARTDIGKSGI